MARRLNNCPVGVPQLIKNTTINQTSVFPRNDINIFCSRHRSPILTIIERLEGYSCEVLKAESMNSGVGGVVEDANSPPISGWPLNPPLRKSPGLGLVVQDWLKLGLVW